MSDEEQAPNGVKVSFQVTALNEIEVSDEGKVLKDDELSSECAETGLGVT